MCCMWVEVSVCCVCVASMCVACSPHATHTHTHTHTAALHTLKQHTGKGCDGNGIGVLHKVFCRHLRTRDQGVGHCYGMGFIWSAWCVASVCVCGVCSVCTWCVCMRAGGVSACGENGGRMGCVWCVCMYCLHVCGMCHMLFVVVVFACGVCMCVVCVGRLVILFFVLNCFGVCAAGVVCVRVWCVWLVVSCGVCCCCGCCRRRGATRIRFEVGTALLHRRPRGCSCDVLCCVHVCVPVCVCVDAMHLCVLQYHYVSLTLWSVLCSGSCHVY